MNNKNKYNRTYVHKIKTKSESIPTVGGPVLAVVIQAFLLVDLNTRTSSKVSCNVLNNRI